MSRRLVALAALLLLVGGTSHAQPAPHLADTLLLLGDGSISPPPALTGAHVFVPATGLTQPLVDSAIDVLPTSDGRDLLFVQDIFESSDRHLRIVALNAETFAQRWTFNALTQATGPRVIEGRWLRLAATDDRVLAAVSSSTADASITIVALARARGSELTRWTANVGLGTGRVDLLPTGEELIVLTYPRPTIHRFRLTDGEAIGAPVRVAQDAAFGEMWALRPVADGTALFGMTETLAGRPAAISFLNLASATIEHLELPFSAPPRDFLPVEDGVSPDGRFLYVYAPTLGQIAVVDLAQRRVAQSVTLDASALQPSFVARALGFLGGLLVSETEAKTPYFGHIQVSPDRQRLYAVGMTPPHEDFRVDGILVIDTQTWRVLDRWLPGMEISTMFLSADGSQLTVQELPWSSRSSAGVVHILSTASGIEASSSPPLQQVELRSVPALFTEQYGHAPTVIATAPLAPPNSVLLASLSSTRTIANAPIALEVRFVDPATGALPASFDAPAQVNAHVFNGRTMDHAFELQASSPGVYRGTFSLPQPRSGSNNAWSVQAVAEWPDGLRRRVELRDAVFVRPSFAGSDGRMYVLDVTTVPDQPRVNEDAEVRATFVESLSGTPLPANVSLVDGLPERLELGFFGTGSSTRWFERVEHGVFGGQVRLWTSGEWRVWTALPRASGGTDTLLIGSFSVQP